MTNFYVDRIPAYLAPLLEKQVREAVARIKAQDRSTPADHWTRGGETGTVMVAMVAGPSEGVVTESLVQREMRRSA